MKAVFSAIAVFSFLSTAPLASAQGIQVNRENRTVSVTVTEAVEAAPEIGIVQIGYHNYGPTQDAVYAENGRVAAAIIQALVEAGLKKEKIQTDAIHLGRVDSEDKQWTAEERKQRQFEARQSWAIRIPTAEAQNVVDHAVSAGANEVQDVDWTVGDPNALESRANAAAVAKARGIAEEMAQKLGSKIGELLYVSNGSQPYLNTNRNFVQFAALETATVSVGPPLKPVLQLFPKKVRREATVYAVFALE